MKALKSFQVVGSALLLTFLLGCYGKVPANGPAALNFAETKLTDGAVAEPYKQVVVVVGGVPPYTYSISSGALPDGLSMDTSGVISGTPTTSGDSSFTVKVVDSQSPTQAYNTQLFTLTINPKLALPATTFPNAIVGIPYSASITASGGIPPYGYTLAPVSDPKSCQGSDCLPAGLTFNSDGTMTGTPTGPPGVAMPTLQVNDQGAATSTAQITINVMGKLQGSFAFSFNGYDNSDSNNPKAFFMAGSFIGDGNGSITSGVFDRNGNDAAGLQTNVAITGGTYTIDNTSLLGTLTLTTAAGSTTYQLSYSALGDTRFILADPNQPNLYGSGVITAQNPQGISLVLTNFTIGFWGVDSAGQRYAGAGAFATASDGTITDLPKIGPAEADINDNGSTQAKLPVSGTFPVTVDKNTGRATATLNFGSTTANYALYLAGTVPVFNFLYAVQIDDPTASPVTLASIMKQNASGGISGIFTNASLNANTGNNAANAVIFQYSAVTNGKPDVTLGSATFTPHDGSMNTYAFDENQGGTITTPAQNSFPGTYNVDPNGRTTLTGPVNPPTWYLFSANQGFAVGTDASVTSGYFEPQSSQPPYHTVSLFGKFTEGSVAPTTAGVTNLAQSDAFTPPPPPGGGPGADVASYDTSGPNAPQPPQGTFTGAYCSMDSSDDPTKCLDPNTTGRILIYNSSSNLPVEVLYVVSGGASGTTGLTSRNVSLSLAKPDGTAVETNPHLNVLVH